MSNTINIDHVLDLDNAVSQYLQKADEKTD